MIFVFCLYCVCSVQTVNGMHLFTTTGYKYYRSFQISLCAGADDFPPATCLNNASLEMQVRYSMIRRLNSKTGKYSASRKPAEYEAQRMERD